MARRPPLDTSEDDRWDDNGDDDYGSPHDDHDDDSTDEDDTDPTISCPKCQRAIYDDAEQCRYCGYYLTDEDETASTTPKWVVVTAVLLLGVILMFWLR